MYNDPEFCHWPYRQSLQHLYMGSPAQMQPQTQFRLIHATVMEGAKACPMPPNSSVALMEGRYGIGYHKVTGTTGFTMRFEYSVEVVMYITMYIP